MRLLLCYLFALTILACENSCYHPNDNSYIQFADEIFLTYVLQDSSGNIIIDFPINISVVDTTYRYGAFQKCLKINMSNDMELTFCMTSPDSSCKLIFGPP